MSFKALNNNTVTEYVMKREKMMKIFPSCSLLKAREVGDGNLNQVFIVEGKDNAVILKQALPYLRVAGDSWPLTLDRMRIETQALLLQSELAPGLVPEIYDHDEEMALIIMEYLGKHEVMRKPLVSRKRFPLFTEHISTFMAQTHFFTSDMYMTGPEKKKLQTKFINPSLCKIQEDFVFTNPFMESADNKWNSIIDPEVKSIRQNGKLKLAIAEMKIGYMTNAQALIHSDLHTGSIMLNETDTRVIDPEFSFCGPIGFDIGALIENIIINYLSHFAHTEDDIKRIEYQEYLLNMVKEIWIKFAEKFEKLWCENTRGDLMPKAYWDYPKGKYDFSEFRRKYIHNILQDTAGYGGCKMLRRMMGIVNVWDITSIEDMGKRSVCERMALKIGERWILERKQIENIDDLIEIVKEESAG